MDEDCAERLADRRERTDRIGVQRECALPLVLRPGDEAVGRRVQNAGRSQILARRPRSGGIEEVEISEAELNQLARPVEGSEAIVPQLAGVAVYDAELTRAAAAPELS